MFLMKLFQPDKLMKQSPSSETGGKYLKKLCSLRESYLSFAQFHLIV